MLIGDDCRRMLKCRVFFHPYRCHPDNGYYHRIFATHRFVAPRQMPPWQLPLQKYITLRHFPPIYMLYNRTVAPLRHSSPVCIPSKTEATSTAATAVTLTFPTPILVPPRQLQPGWRLSFATKTFATLGQMPWWILPSPKKISSFFIS